MAYDKVVDSGALDTGLTSIANKIRSRSGGSNQLLFPTGFVSEIDNIPQGGGGIEEKDVNFYDYDGTLVASYTTAEFAALSAMPSNPTHTGLTAQGWNWSLAEAKTYVASYGKLNIGQMYTTSDGKTRIYVDFTGWNYEIGFNFTLYFAQGIYSEVTIDFGDGSDEETLSSDSSGGWASIEHWYDSGTAYVITITPVEGSFSIQGDGGHISSQLMCWPWEDSENTLSPYAYSSYANTVKKVELGQSAGIGFAAFMKCSNLESITIPSGIESIGQYAFSGCRALKSVTIPSGMSSGYRMINTYTFINCESLKSITIPNDITSIESNAFASCFSLKSATLSSNITAIAGNAFQNCYDIKYITIPSGVTSIGSRTFSNCFSLEAITIPSGVTSIGTYAFQNCETIKSVTIPSGVTKVDNYTFDACYNLETVTIPNSVTSIGDNAFSNCSSLKTINSNDSAVIPSRVTSIGQSAFQQCYSLYYVRVPSSVTSIGKNAFSKCSHVIEYTFERTTPPTLGATAFNTIQPYCAIYVPEESVTAYRTASGWSTYASYIQ